MANTSIVTQEMLQDTLQNYHDNLVYPFLNGATHTGCVPVGSRLDGWFPTTPKYYLYCDGAEYLKSDYPELAELLAQVDDINSTTLYVGSDANHFKVPDLRGEFIRGTGSNSHTNQGSGANVGVHQDATETVNIEAYYSPNDNKSVITATRYGSLNDNDYYTKNADSTFGNAVYGGGISGSVGNWGSAYNKITSRPTNTSLPQYICYKTHYIDLALDSFPISISNPTDGQALVWNATEGRWVNGGHKYSTNEHVVGTWIDGRPVYEKTFQFLKSNLASGNNSLNHSISDIDLMWMDLNHSFLKESTYNEIWNFGGWNGETTYDFKVFGLNCSATKINFYIGSNVFDRMTSSDYVVATLQYIKTTN